MGFLKNITLNNNAIDFSIDSLLKVGNYIYGFGKFSRIINSSLKFHGIIVKLNSQGEVIWSKLYLDNDLGDIGINFDNAFTDSSNNLYVWGVNDYSTLSTSDVNKNTSRYNDVVYTITKLSQEGNLIWHKKIVLSSYSWSIFRKIDNNTLLFATTNHDGYIELSKIDASTGNIVLSKQVNFLQPDISIENINIDVYSNNILLIGNRIVENVYKGVCYIIDNNFNLVDYIEILHPDKSFRLREVDPTEVDLEIYGYTDNETLFGFARYLSTYNYNTQNVLSFKKMTGLFSIQKINTGIYLTDDSSIIELDTSFSLVKRTKKINFIPETIIPTMNNSFTIDTFLITRRNIIGNWDVFGNESNCFISANTTTYNISSQNIKLIKYHVNDYAFLSNSNSHVFTSPTLQIEVGQHSIDNFCKVIVTGRQINHLVFNKGIDVNQIVGSVQIENKGTGSYNFAKGQLIASGNGLDFYMDEVVTLGEYDSKSVSIRAIGKSLNLGDFSFPINIDGVSNPFGYDIAFSVILDSNPIIYIKEDKTSVPSLSIGVQVTNLEIGTLKIQNNTGSAISVSSGTIIASANGMYFSLKESATFTAGSTTDVIVLANGKPEAEGNFAPIIFLYEIQNPYNFSIEFQVKGEVVVINPNNTKFQAPNFYLQAVGSKGNDSTKGIHLRWIFGGVLGEKHLPKRNYAKTTHNFNKPNDVVKVYRAKYQKIQFTLNLFDIPSQIDDANQYWVYRSANNREIYVYFRNTSKYSQIRSTVSPLSNPSLFIQSYGNELIEIDSRNDLFFAVEMKMINVTSNSFLQTESLSVSINNPSALKNISSRKTFNSSNFSTARLVCENGRSIRYKTSNCQVSVIIFEFYSDFITTINERAGWKLLGDFGLTLDDNSAFSLLEPKQGCVHGHWQRFNDNAFVNIENYKSKWNRQTESWDRNIKQIVNNYIILSDSASNPTAIESVSFENDDESVEISNLDQLNLASYDYHIARMLGLGFLDIEENLLEDKYIYIAEYTSTGDLEDGLGKREVHHLSMSLPTSINDERLPIPIDLKSIMAGSFWGNEGEAVNLTDENGYTHNGEARYVTLYSEEATNDNIGASFYHSDDEFSLEQNTYSVYAGIEYRKVPTGQTDNGIWEKPELPNDKKYFNAVPSGEKPHNETRLLQIPDINQPLYVHKQEISGMHYYGSYGINWFSRTSTSKVTKSIETTLHPKNLLLPPSNINPLLIRDEAPLFLTSQEEQNRLNDISGDKTLVRLTFDYHTQQDMIIRNVKMDSLVTNSEILDSSNANDVNIFYPDNQEIFAEEVDIFFRNKVPNNVSGKIISVNDHPINNLLSNLETADYYMSSVGQTVSPFLVQGTENNYIGGTLVMGDQQYIIYGVEQGIKGPIFTVYKKEISNALVNDIPSADADNLQPVEIVGDGFFIAVENMQNEISWGTPNPLSLKVNVAVNSKIHREIIETMDEDGNTERRVEKTRGIWGSALIEKIEEPIAPIYDSNGVITGYIKEHKGTYKITFSNTKLLQHPQYKSDGLSVEWFRGVARIFTAKSVQGGVAYKSRKILQVIKIENIIYPNDANQNNLVIYVNDPNFVKDQNYDGIQIGNNILVNFYPGYKVYLYKDSAYGLDSGNILPSMGEGTRYSIFGMRSRDLGLQQYHSKISVPSLMFAQETIEALSPEEPEGPLYATRPDFFGRSTYSITAKYKHQPHGLLFYRSNDEAILNALYEKETIKKIRESLKILGGNDEEYFTNRWKNFLDFDALKNKGDYETYPPKEISDDGYKFPNPNKKALFTWANEILERLGQPLITESPGTLLAGDKKFINFVKGAIYSAFVPITELPIIYEHIEGKLYNPVDEKQVVRSKDGYVLSPNHQDFKMAPMMKRTGNDKYETLFVDFHIDGTSNNIYFYGIKELSSQMKMGDFSPFLGPVKLVNTNAPEAPEIKRIIPILENKVLGIIPKIQIEFNAYPDIQNIKKITVYRSFSKLDAQSVRTMSLVNTFDIVDMNMQADSVWKIWDEFNDLEEIPYGDGFFYRITVSREVQYADKDNQIITEYVPSQSSKIVATMMAEVTNPKSPTLSYYSEPITNNGILQNVTLSFGKTCYKGKYHLYKLSSQGNWKKIYEIKSNDANIYIPIVETELNNANLDVRDEDNNPVYHHFKVVAENTSGMFSQEENILTIYNENTWKNINEIF